MNTTLRISLARVLAVLVLPGALAAVLPGCNIVGPAYLLVHGPEKVPRKFELPKDRPTIIFVDDRANSLPRRSLRQTIADAAQKVLLEKHVLTNVIDSRAALAVAAQDRSGEPKPITEIGKAAQAEIVIYVTVDGFTLSPDGQTFAPGASVRIKVIDVANDTRLWPEDKAGFAFSTQSPAQTGTAPTSQSQVALGEDGAAQRTGLAIAQCFFEHVATDSAIKPQ